MFVAVPKRWARTWAAVTAGLPGPTILRTRGKVAVPNVERGDPGRAVRPEDVRQAQLVGDGEGGAVHRAGARHRRDEDGDLRHAGDDGRHADLDED